MLSSTRKDYEEKYDSRLSDHKKVYFENDATSFLELELSNYTKYYNSLIKISEYFKNKKAEDIKLSPTITEVISDLKNINEPVFDEIIEIEKTKVITDKVTLDSGFVDEMIRGFIPGRVKIHYEKLDNLITSAKKILEFINNKLSSPQDLDVPKDITDNGSSKKLEVLEPEEKLENPYPQVFSNTDAFILFERLHENYRTSKTSLADYSFIYRMMYDDGYILDSYKPQMFINWLSKHYQIELPKIKTRYKCTTKSKIQNYNTIKEILQIKKFPS